MTDPFKMAVKKRCHYCGERTLRRIFEDGQERPCCERCEYELFEMDNAILEDGESKAEP